MTAWHEEPINKRHNLKAFDCGNSGLTDFLVRYARWSHDMGGVKTFLAIDDLERTIRGFYSLGPVSIQTSKPDVAPWGVCRREQPGFRLAYLAVDRRVQGQGLGGQLLLAAARRCLLASIEVGGVVLLTYATNDKVKRWYASYGALPLLDKPLLLLPLATIEGVLKRNLKL